MPGSGASQIHQYPSKFKTDGIPIVLNPSVVRKCLLLDHDSNPQHLHTVSYHHCADPFWIYHASVDANDWLHHLFALSADQRDSNDRLREALQRVHDSSADAVAHEDRRHGPRKRCMGGQPAEQKRQRSVREHSIRPPYSAQCNLRLCLFCLDL